MRRFQFHVDTIAEAHGRIYVGGGVYGDLIRLGDGFSSAASGPPSEGSSATGCHAVSVVVRGILLYGRYMNQVDSHMTAELELEPLSEARPSTGELLVGEGLSPPFSSYDILGRGDFHVKSI